MATKFGFLSRLNFLQDLASVCISKVNPAIIHNLEKYYIIKKVHYLSAIDDMEGDYLEFGVFTGSSFCHSIRSYRELAHLNPNHLKTRFWGFDSFGGFGTLATDDVHTFYTDENFAASLPQVNSRVRRVAKRDIDYQLVPGFFSDSLKNGVSQYSLCKARIIFIDSDTYSSANEALIFCLPIVQEGTYIILDDYFSYKGSMGKGVARAFTEFVERGKLEVRRVFTYGMGGVVYVVSAVMK